MNRFHEKTIYEALGREPVHPFPARMAPGIALAVMSDIEESVVLDPMMGSGTVLAMARAKGHFGIGFDIDPLAVLISKVWTTAFDPEDIRENASSEHLGPWTFPTVGRTGHYHHNRARPGEGSTAVHAYPIDGPGSPQLP